MRLRMIFSAVVLLLVPAIGSAWAEHPLLVRPVLEELEIWEKMDSVEVRELVTFLEANSRELAVFLEEHEKWAEGHLHNYRQRPDDLRFNPELKGAELRTSFLRAIRIHPESKIPLYLHLMPGETTEEHLVLDPAEISLFDNLGKERETVYRQLREGQKADALDVLVSANDEPDYGFDLGLFEDNDTPHGREYGFGNQPFGNPNLVNSSQGPFHMAFYHEPGIVYAVAPFLDNSLLESRLFLYRALSVFAFNQGEEYWGWRFLGWSMHYAGDLSMPYHSSPLPGFSVLQMVVSQLHAMRGDESRQRDMIQLVSNRHMVIEAYQHAVLTEAHRSGKEDHLFLRALRRESELPEFDYQFARKVASFNAAQRADEMSEAVIDAMPRSLVDDPMIEARHASDLQKLRQMAIEESENEALDLLNRQIAARFRDFSVNVRTLLFSVLEESVTQY